MMTKNQGFALTIGILLLIGGTIIHWFVPWTSIDLKEDAISYLSLVVTLAGFGFTIYELRQTEKSILEGMQKPNLELEVLPHASGGQFGSEKIHRLVLAPNDKNRSLLKSRFALRIVNTGKKSASFVLLTFIIRRKSAPEGDVISKVNIDYIKSALEFDPISYWAADTRNGYTLGWTFRLGEDIPIYADRYDRPVIAVLDINMDKANFEPEYEIHYRINSYEGNEALDNIITSRTGNQVYALHLDRLPNDVYSGTSITVSDSISQNITVAGRDVRVGHPVDGLERKKTSRKTQR